MIRFSFMICIFITTLFADSFKDSLNREVTLLHTPQKIVTIGPGALRLLSYFDVENILVGIEKIEHKGIGFSEYRSALGKQLIESLPIIGSGGPGKLPNLEALVASKADVIIASFLNKSQLELISKKTKIPTFALSYGAGYGGSEQKLQAIAKSIELLGILLDKTKRAKEIVSFMETQRQELKALEFDKTQTLYIGGMGYKGAHGITSTEINYPSFDLLGLQNSLTKNQSGTHMFIQEESLLQANPKFIFLDLFGKKIITEEMQSKAALYSMLQAYKNRNMHWLLAYNFYNTNVANVYINAWIIAKAMGANVDVQAKMQEVYSVFYGKKASKLVQKRYPLPEL